ncbi:MAG: ATP-binding protein [Desulfovibrio sp.]|nr:ATP-binding protein [Desulfovibrio sp.]
MKSRLARVFSARGVRALHLGLSPWMVVGMAIILGLAISALAVRSNQRGKTYMIQNLMDRAEALIWALEAGARTGLCAPLGNPDGLQSLLAETAKQPGIVFMAVANNAGEMLAYSVPVRHRERNRGDADALLPGQRGSGGTPRAQAQQGEKALALIMPTAVQVTEKPAWRLRQWGDRKVFEVYRAFVPLDDGRPIPIPMPMPMRGHGQHMGRGKGMMGAEMPHGPMSPRRMEPPAQAMGDGMSGGVGGFSPGFRPGMPGAEAPGGVSAWTPAPLKPGQPRQQQGVVVVGLDLKPFEAALAADLRYNVMSALLVAALGLAGFVSLFWAHNYRRSRRMLRDSRAMASEVVANLPLGLLTSDPSGRVAMVNETALGMFELDRATAVHAPLTGLPGLDWTALVAELAGGRKVLERECVLTTGRTGAVISLSAAAMSNQDGVFLGNVFILRDITDVKRLQADAQRNDRLSALGHLAAGVAHEVRNPLSTIKGVALYIAKRMLPGGREEEAAQRMIDEVDRLDRVVSELLEFARPGAISTADADLGEIISRALRLAEADVRARNIQVSLDVAPGLPLVRVNTERLTQALLNLFLNAVQAMGAEGRLRVGARLSPDGQTFTITVGDNGPGISRDIQAAIFTPYFTTKPSGTGLGLAIVYQIVEGHGGNVSVNSSPGQGTEFILVFPVRGKDETPPPNPKKK